MVAVAPLTTFCKTLKHSRPDCRQLFNTPVHLLKVCLPETVWNDILNKQ